MNRNRYRGKKKKKMKRKKRKGTHISSGQVPHRAELGHMDVLKEPSSLIFQVTCLHAIGYNSHLVDDTRNLTCNKDNTLGPATLSLRGQCQVGQTTLRSCHVMPKSSRNTKKIVFLKKFEDNIPIYHYNYDEKEEEEEKREKAYEL